MGVVRKPLTGIVFFVAASVLPAWAQQTGAVTITVPNIMAGLDSKDPTLVWTTTLRLVNRTTNVHNAILVVDPGNPNSSGVRVTIANGASFLIGEMLTYISPLGERRYVLQGVDTSAVAGPIPVTIESLRNDDGLPHIVASALVQQADANGRILRSYEVVDSSTVSTVPGRALAVPVDLLVDGVDVALLLSNPSNGGVTVTFAVYDGNNTADGRVPLTRVDVMVPPRRTIAITVSQLFANADFGSFFSDPNNLVVQQLLVITSDQPFGLAVIRSNIGSDGSLIATAANAFPLAQ